ncbi:MAG: hypothetical protein DCF15_15875 [Phormidesmis priestleyi]|uniref:Uncharacterized protein n=1 Tax=Phormidesmis priestleyi TaxID=268141 RepID=A0A2W4WZ71_9CYAN|nr:MAG: hypothetical protein DCF15_15875 [Phormidesmis priestleyi]
MRPLPPPNQAKISARPLARLLASLLAGTIGTLFMASSPAHAQRTTVFELDQAICANNWSSAIDIAGMLMASDGEAFQGNRITQDQRTALLALRQQLERYRSEQVVLPGAEACDRTDPYFLTASTPTVQSSQPLGWQGAVAEATGNRYSSVVLTEPTAFSLPVAMGEAAGLTPAAPVDLRNGMNVVAGHVGTGHEVYGFVARLGDRLTVDLAVTQVMAGSLYTSGDSQLFVFDRNGQLVASADDSDLVTEPVNNNFSNPSYSNSASNRQQSRISGFIIPKTDVYFAVVTSYNNDPILNREGQLTGWQDNGGGRFDYTLTFSGVTPTNALVP